MDEAEETPSTNPNPRQSVPVCEECKSNPSKYKCPGCSVRSCSLQCVKGHKRRTGCMGKRQQTTEFVPLSQFNDNVLLSDYNMLEDVKRVAESAQRLRLKLCTYSHFRLPFPLKSLRSAAAARRTKLLFLPGGMSRREANRSYYNNRKKLICWTVEWRFHSTDVVLIDHGVDENTSLCSLIEKHLRPGPWNHPLRQFCEEPLDSLKFFIRKYPKGPKAPFRELDIGAPIRQQLANLVILEYPVIHAFLSSDHHDFEVIKEVKPRKAKVEERISNSCASPKGVTFQEEEIQDDGSLNTQVLDLMKNAKPDHVLQISHQDKGTERELDSKFGIPSLEKTAQGTELVSNNDAYIHKGQDSIQSGFRTNDPEVLADMDLDFDFEQGLIDAYSDIIAQTNPDDFLDFESVFPEDTELQEIRDHPDSSGVCSVKEELEEGEIP
ncbi:uncharacterized protein LOC127787030 [Diospyros lotus]|uniref:uncharacterized protein LOC127787030 n=1 Tax=Diospyros lotus TaxID=55363 RepID=UPI00225B149F|nr:uncharacterized protein LOC127787030 [Diospyros lotus]